MSGRGALVRGFPLAAFRRSLLAWYHRGDRGLPWRATRDPWAILVSEMMLQQTQVATVKPYWESFMRRWPTPGALAKAPIDRVLAAWSGLGYYRRARHLHEAAKCLAARGGFPESVEGLRNLPGLGDYAAAAVGSIAFGLPAAAVDGNVVRVTCRLLAIGDDPTRAPGREAVRAAAQALLEPRQAGDWNQAMMDLGALVCTPTKPGCPLCPGRKACRALAQGNPEGFPRAPKRAKARPRLEVAALAAAREGKRLRLLARPRGADEEGPGELLGFWTFPMEEAKAVHPEDQARALLARCLGQAPVGRPQALPSASRSVTQWRITTRPYLFVLQGEPAAPAPWRWVDMAALERRPMGSGDKRLLALARKALVPKGAGKTGGPSQLGLDL